MSGLTPGQASELAVALTIAIIGAATILWGLWHAFWMAFDHFSERLTRRRNRRHCEINPRTVWKRDWL